MNKFLSNFSEGFFGERPLYVHAVCMVFALIGAYIITYIRAKNRDKLAPGTPYKFNLGFMIVKNIKDAFFALTLSFAVFRFSNHWADDESQLYVYALILGLCFNAVVLGVEKLVEKFSKKITDKIEKI